MARYIAISFSTFIVLFFTSLGNAFAANPQISNIAPLTSPGVKFPVGQPLGLSVIFSRNVYGFDIADVVTNGKVVSVEGANRHYRIVVIPNQRLLTLEIFADSARDINSKGNDPILNGPFIFDTENSRVLSGGQYNPFFIAAPIERQAAPVAKRVAVVKEEVPVATAPAPKKQWNEAFQGYRFIMNLGVYSGGPKFINTRNQTPAKATSSQELTLGFETVHLFPKRKELSGGFYLLTGYHRTLYEGGSGTTETEASYTAIPLELGTGFHVRNYMTLGFGVVTHLSGSYAHEGPLTLAGATGSPFDTDFTANLNSQLGFAFNLNFRVRKFAFNFRYLRLPLGNFSDATNDLGLSGQGVSSEYETSNFIDSAGFFIGFNS